MCLHYSYSVLFTAKSRRVYIPLPSYFLFRSKLSIFACVIFFLRFMSKPHDRSGSQADTFRLVGALAGRRRARCGRRRGPGPAPERCLPAPSCFAISLLLFLDAPSGSSENDCKGPCRLPGCCYCDGGCLGPSLLWSKRTQFPECGRLPPQ